jgi:hypothetical protein
VGYPSRSPYSWPGVSLAPVSGLLRQPPGGGAGLRPPQRPLRQRLVDVVSGSQHLLRLVLPTRSMQNLLCLFLQRRRRARIPLWVSASASCVPENAASAEPTRAAPASFIARPREMVSSATPVAKPSSLWFSSGIGVPPSEARGETPRPHRVYATRLVTPVRLG